jgi:sugar/nucleoside kinase (ribokinase family)
MSRIVVVGDLNLDVHAQYPADLDPGTEVRSSVWAEPGGSAGTFARVAAGSGASVAFFGCVGDDLIGDLLVRSLEVCGIRPIVGRVEGPSGTILALKQGTERTMICSRGANDGLTAERIDEAAFDAADHLHISGYAFLSATQREAARRAIAIGCARAITISVDPPPASLIAAFGVDAFRAALADATWIFPNLAEAQTLTNLDAPEAIADSLASWFPTGAITLGPSGALAWSGEDRSLYTPTETLSGDSTGAGDAFAAAFVVAILEHAPLSQANARGCEAAAAHIRTRRCTCEGS